jgi:hypothetical protein
MKLDWIAEGVITSITTGRGQDTYNVQWTRVQNLYPGIGPSPLWCQNGQCAYTKQASEDISWQYNDCRFILRDDIDTNSRHFDVSRALLGTSLSDPMGWSVLSVSKYNDSEFIDFVVQSVTMYISPQNTGAIDTQTRFAPGTNQPSNAAKFFNDNATPFAATSWNLTSQFVPATQLQKIFFYSIMPVDFGPPTDEAHTSHLSEFKRHYSSVGGLLIH